LSKWVNWQCSDWQWLLGWCGGPVADEVCEVLSVGKKKKVIANFYIPKLELFQSMVPSIHANGANTQWSADMTEHAHITEIKIPADATNNQNYEDQICCHLDCLDKIRRFNLATTIHEADIQLDLHKGDVATATATEASLDASLDDNLAQLPALQSTSLMTNTLNSTHLTVNYFKEAASLNAGEDPHAPRPFRMFSAGTLAFHLNCEAQFKLMAIDNVALAYNLPDLQQAIAHYLLRHSHGEQFIQSLGGWRPTFLASEQLLFNKIQVWTRVRVQTLSYFNPEQVLEPQTLEAEPPSNRMPHGCYNSTLVNIDQSHNWPQSGISGEYKLCGFFT
jgi:hypothetical protein